MHIKQQSTVWKTYAQQKSMHLTMRMAAIVKRGK